MIVDMTVGYEMYPLIDGFFGYNQIKISPSDQVKIAFTCVRYFMLECHAL